MRDKLESMTLRIKEFISKGKTPVSREMLGIHSDDTSIHIDVFGEGPLTGLGFTISGTELVAAGFTTSLNLNANTEISGISKPIPLRVELNGHDAVFPFADDFADFITVMNSPIAPGDNKATTEIPRIIRDNGKAIFWVDPKYGTDIRTIFSEIRAKYSHRRVTWAELTEDPYFHGRAQYTPQQILIQKNV